MTKPTQARTYYPAQAAYLLAQAHRDVTYADRAALLAPIHAARHAGQVTKEQHRAQVAQAERDNPAVFQAAYEAGDLYWSARENLLEFGRARMQEAAARHPEALPNGPAELMALFDNAWIVGPQSDRLVDLVMKL